MEVTDDLPEETGGKVKSLTKPEIMKMELLVERLAHHEQRLKTVLLAEQLVEKEIEIQKIKSTVALLEARVLSLPNPKLVESKGIISEAIEKAEGAKEDYARALMKKYSIQTPNFGFLPETGEIIEDV